MSEGIVFNIQKYSIHDGPGIRTTVFLKGCPLHCAWCANPESQSSRIQILYDADKCCRCLSCVHTCPMHAIHHEDNHIYIDETLCNGCLACTKVCPKEALSHEGEKKSVQEVLDVCRQDLPFYEESKGGVTISGGEGMVQKDFCRELVTALKQNHIHTAIETTGCVSADTFHELAPLFDLLLFDIKHYDPDLHRKGTGVTNEQILANLRWAIAHHLNILPRIPVIPGFNASLEDAAGLAHLISSLHLTEVQLLPFHQMGEKKYAFLNRDYALTGVKALHPEDLEAYRQVFLNEGIRAYF